MHRPRYYFALIEETDPRPPARFVPRRSRYPETSRQPQFVGPLDPLAALLEALVASGYRGTGSSAWALPNDRNPLAFVLDSLGDAILVRDTHGRVLYRNRSARTLPTPLPTTASREEVVLDGDRWVRRTAQVHRGGTRYCIDVMTRTERGPR